MIASIVLAIITIVMVSDAYLKPSILKYVIMLFSAIFAVIIGFSYFELLGGLLFDKGFLMHHIYALSFLVITVVAFVVFKVIGDYIIRPEIKFPGQVPKFGSVVCSLVLSLMITGIFFIFFSLLPMSPKYPYSRFAHKAVIVNQYLDIDPSKPLISPDAFVAGIFNTVSGGGFGSDRSFAVLRAGFIDSCFLNRQNIKDETSQINAITGKDAIKISMADKNTVRKAHTNLRTTEGKPVPQIAGKELYIVKCPFNFMRIESGGAIDGSQSLELLPCQIRIMCNDTYEGGLKGKGLAVYPYGYLDDGGRLVRANLLNVVNIERVASADNSQRSLKDVYMAFYVPEAMVPVAIAYKQNFVARLPSQPQAGDVRTEEN